MSDQLHANERGTRVLFGKPYHWVRVDGVLHLVAGEAPEAVAR